MERSASKRRRTAAVVSQIDEPPSVRKRLLLGTFKKAHGSYLVISSAPPHYSIPGVGVLRMRSFISTLILHPLSDYCSHHHVCSTVLD